MLFHVEVNGRLREVTVERHDRVFKVGVDGRRHLVSVAQVDGSTLSVIVLGKRVSSHEVGTGAGHAVYIDGVEVEAALVTRRRSPASGRDHAGGAGAARVVAPMPGKVIRVLVAPGDRVQARQPVAVVEAMKMENELRTPQAGLVTEVAVQPGASVEAGAELVVIETR
jgi:biotin carboxyl carrier protein